MRPLLRRAAVTAIALAAAVGIAAPASAAPDRAAGTLTIEDVGSSPFLSWSWGITNPPTIGSGSGGAGAGKLTLADFHISKRIDPLSTELTRAVATGQHFPEATISIPIGGPGSPFEVEYTLRQVIVSSLQQSGSADGSAESVAFSYGAFQQSVGNTSQFGWANGG